MEQLGTAAIMDFKQMKSDIRSALARENIIIF
jgi:hypothetical protein